MKMLAKKTRCYAFAMQRIAEKIIESYEPTRLADDVKKQLTERMSQAARSHGMESLPKQ